MAQEKKSVPATVRSTVSEPSLPDSELEVMRVLWKLGAAKARDVLNELQANGSSWSYATVNTLLQRLESKGLARSDKSRMTYTYSPTISQQEVRQKRVNQLVSKLYDGKSAPLVMHLLREQALSNDEVHAIRELLNQVTDNETPTPTSSPKSASTRPATGETCSSPAKPETGKRQRR